MANLQAFIQYLAIIFKELLENAKKELFKCRLSVLKILIADLQREMSLANSYDNARSFSKIGISKSDSFFASSDHINR